MPLWGVPYDCRAAVPGARVRHRLNFVGQKQGKSVVGDLRLIYTAATNDEALGRLA
jgi:transposase-like protein